MNFKRIIAVILMAFLAVNIVGCNKKTDNTRFKIYRYSNRTIGR